MSCISVPIFCHRGKSEILADNSGDNSDRYPTLFVNSRHRKAHIILFSGHPLVIAGVSHCIHPIGKPDINDTFMNVRNLTCILTLNPAFFQIFAVVILGHTLDISLYADILQAVPSHPKDAHQHLIAHRKSLMGVPTQSQARSRAIIEHSTPKISTRITFSATAMIRAWTTRPS